MALSSSFIRTLYRIEQSSNFPPWYLPRGFNIRKCINTNNTFLRLNCKDVDVDHDIKINNLSLKNYLQHLCNKYQALSKAQEKADTKATLSQLRPVVDLIEKRKTIFQQFESLKELSKEEDGELRKMVEEEKTELHQQLTVLDQQLVDVLLNTHRDDDFNSIVLEVSAGVGGQEAMLFANELFEMYCKFAEYKGWDVIIAEYDTSDLGGIRHGSVLINGEGAYSAFKFEAGVHRVQRIPVTEKSGRIHTSTASVRALPQPTDININIQQKDLKIETKRASGAGGQHVNTTDSAVRIVHLPTGVSVECQVDRSQIKNREIALTKLKALLYQKQLESQLADAEATRKSQVQSNFRNEKIRTYNFPQDRISDHRLQGNFHNIKVFLNGGEQLETLIGQLDREYRFKKLLEDVNDVKSSYE